jgi:hypothetical protein
MLRGDHPALMTKCRSLNRGSAGRDQAGRRANMFDWLIPLLIVIVLLIKIFDFLDLLDLVATVVSLIVAAIMLTAKLLARLIRSLADVSNAKA